MFIEFSTKKLPARKRPSDLPKLAVVLDDMTAYEVLCPVNKLTGLRENPLRLLKTLVNNPDKERALSSVLQEVGDMRNSGVSDDDLVDFMAERLSTGTPYDNDVFRQRLSGISEPLFNYVAPKSSTETQEVEKSSDEKIIDNV